MLDSSWHFLSIHASYNASYNSETEISSHSQLHSVQCTQVHFFDPTGSNQFLCAEVKKELQKSGQAGKISIRVTQPMSRSLARKKTVSQTKWQQNSNILVHFLCRKAKTRKWCQKTVPWNWHVNQGVIHNHTAGCIKPACRASMVECMSSASCSRQTDARNRQMLFNAGGHT